MAKSIKRNFFYNILLNVSKVIFPLITAPYVSRVLEPDGIGLFNFANTYANFLALVAALGVPYYGIREIAKISGEKEKQTKFMSEIMSLTVISTLICIVILFFSLIFVPRLNENYIIFLVASIVLYSTPFRIDWYYSGKEDFGYITFRSLLLKTLSVFLLFFLVKNKDDLLAYVALFAVSTAANDVWNFIKLYQSGIHPHITISFKRHLKPLMLLFSSSIALYVYTVLDTLMLGFMKDYTEVGYYNSATHISKAMVPIVTSLAVVALPKVSQYKEKRQWKEINKLMNKSFSLVGFLSFPIAFGIMSVAPYFVPLFFGEQFYGTILPLQIIILTVVVIGFNNLTGIQILLGFGKDKLFLYSIVAGTITNIALNLFLIPLLGAVGTAISAVCAEIVVLSIMLYFVYKTTPIRFVEFKEILVTIAISSLFFIISQFVFSSYEGWKGVLLTIILCTIFYLLCQYFVKSPSERALLGLVIKKMRRYE